MKPIIFAVEDDTALQELYLYSLEGDYDCRCFDDGELFFEALGQATPDLVLLDVMLPGEDGFAILTRLKRDADTSHIPVIMVSAKGEELSKVRGLNAGADDYLTKPFGILEFSARIKANLRRVKRAVSEGMSYKDLVIDFSKHAVSVKGAPIQTTLKEYKLLCLLCENVEKVQSRDIIFDRVWDGAFAGETRTLDIHIKELRKKLAEATSEVSIKTIRGVGYLLT